MVGNARFTGVSDACDSTAGRPAKQASGCAAVEWRRHKGSVRGFPSPGMRKSRMIERPCWDEMNHLPPPRLPTMLRWKLSHAVIVAVSLTAFAVISWSVMSWSSADPASMSGRQLLVCVATRDLAQASPEFQAAFLERMLQWLEQPKRLDASSAGFALPQITPTWSARLESNIQHLQRLWLATRLDAFAELETSERRAFLEKQIDVLIHWQQATRTVRSATESVSSGGGLESLSENLAALLSQYTGQERSLRQTAVREALILWLSKTSLGETSEATRWSLAQRIAHSLASPSTSSSSLLSFQLDKSEVEMLHHNAMLLLQTWLLHESRSYADQPESEQTARLDAAAALLESKSLSGMWGESGEPADRLSQWNRELNQWIRELPESTRQRVEPLVLGIKGRLLWRRFQSWRQEVTQP